jgi:hypothetical protein
VAASGNGRPVYLLGESFGGLVSLALAAQCPGMVDRVVLVNPATSFADSIWPAAGQLLPALPEAVYNLLPFALSPFITNPLALAGHAVDSSKPPLEQVGRRQGWGGGYITQGAGRGGCRQLLPWRGRRGGLGRSWARCGAACGQAGPTGAGGWRVVWRGARAGGAEGRLPRALLQASDLLYGLLAITPELGELRTVLPAATLAHRLELLAQGSAAVEGLLEQVRPPGTAGYSLGRGGSLWFTAAQQPAPDALRPPPLPAHTHTHIHTPHPFLGGAASTAGAGQAGCWALKQRLIQQGTDCQ